jgi:spore germination protein PB
MEWTIHQQITIHKLEVGSVANSSILQIGSAGLIKGLSQLFNTGGFAGPAPELTGPAPGAAGPVPPASILPSSPEGPGGSPLVPLPLPAED